jgi:hypothetical protein
MTTRESSRAIHLLEDVAERYACGALLEEMIDDAEDVAYGRSDGLASEWWQAIGAYSPPVGEMEGDREILIAVRDAIGQAATWDYPT